MLPFTPEEKLRLFDRIAERYYDHNFGSMMKADLDTLIFSAYLDHCIGSGEPYDDYTLSVQLGLTESRVRSLKERKQLHYPIEGYDWQKAFAALIPNARYNDVKKMVQLGIEDVNLLKEVRHFVREQGWYDEFQLNPRLFQCRLDYFILLCSRLGDPVSLTPEARQQLEVLGKNEQEQTAVGKLLSGTFEDGIKDLVLNTSRELVTGVLNVFPFGGAAGAAIRALIRIIEK